MVVTLLGALPAYAAVEFTGNVLADFEAKYCFDDLGGQDVGIPAKYPVEVSGFDIAKLCLQYDTDTNTLYVGVGTFPDPDTGEPVVFGDADNNGYGDTVGDELKAVEPAFFDFADLGTGEYFALIIDFDNDLATTPDFIAGVSFTKDISGFTVAKVAEPVSPLSLSFLDDAYGNAIATSSDSAIAFSPDMEHPNLEFTVTNLSKMEGFEALDFDSPDYEIGVYFTSGSMADGGIGEDTFGVVDALNSKELAEITKETEKSSDDENGDEESDGDENGDDDDTLPPPDTAISGPQCQNTIDPDLCNYADAFVQGGSFGCSLSYAPTTANAPAIFIVAILFLAGYFIISKLDARL